DTTSTTAFGSLPAASLNLRVEVAHTEVSRLGTMLRIFFFPLNSASETSFRSVLVSLKSGAFAPTAGSSPFVWMGVPLNVTWAMGLCLRVDSSGAADMYDVRPRVARPDSPRHTVGE